MANIVKKYGKQIAMAVGIAILIYDHAFPRSTNEV